MPGHSRPASTLFDHARDGHVEYALRSGALFLPRLLLRISVRFQRFLEVLDPVEEGLSVG